MRKTAFVLALLLALSFITVMPVGTLAGSGGLDFEVTGGVSGTDYSFDLDSYMAVKDGANIKINMKSGLTSTNQWISIESNAVVSITLENINIELTTSFSPIYIGDGARVTIYLSGTNTLRAYNTSYDIYAALRVAEGSVLTITNAPGASGSLNAIAAAYGAGIGGNYAENCGRVAIINAAVTAQSRHGAGIGGGLCEQSNNRGGKGGDITIAQNSIVTATSFNGAGIGGGAGESVGGDGGIVIISSSTVYASSTNADGIGGGWAITRRGSGGTIKLTNSYVIARTNDANKDTMSALGAEPVLSYPGSYKWRVSETNAAPVDFVEEPTYEWNELQKYVELVPLNIPVAGAFNSMITYTHDDWVRDNQYDVMAPASGLEPDKAMPAEDLFGTAATTTTDEQNPVGNEDPQGLTIPPQTEDNATLVGFIMVLVGVGALMVRRKRV